MLFSGVHYVMLRLLTHLNVVFQMIPNPGSPYEQNWSNPWQGIRVDIEEVRNVEQSSIVHRPGIHLVQISLNILDCRFPVEEW